MLRFVTTIGLVAATALALYWLLLYVAQRSLIFPAPPAGGRSRRPADAEQVWLPAPDGRVEAWFLPPTTGSGRAPLLLFTHGNAELIDDWPDAFGPPRAWGMAVLLLEYPGYGRSEGRPSQASLTAAAWAAADWAPTHPRIDAARIVPYGRSLGGFSAATVAADRSAAALILESSFTSARAFARRFGAPGLLVRDPLDTLAAVRRFDGPLLVLHGEVDDIVPTRHGLALAAASSRATLRLLPCGHNDCSRPWEAVRSFLARHGLIDPPS